MTASPGRSISRSIKRIESGGSKSIHPDGGDVFAVHPDSKIDQVRHRSMAMGPQLAESGAASRPQSSRRPARFAHWCAKSDQVSPPAGTAWHPRIRDFRGQRPRACSAIARAINALATVPIAGRHSRKRRRPRQTPTLAREARPGDRLRASGPPNQNNGAVTAIGVAALPKNRTVWLRVSAFGRHCKVFSAPRTPSR
jgi:hypothetical protein